MRTDQSAYYYGLVEQQKQSGQNITQFCKQHSVNLKTFYYWKKKSKAQGVKGFTPLSIVEDKIKEALTIQYADGTRLIFEGNVNTSLIKQFLPAFVR